MRKILKWAGVVLGGLIAFVVIIVAGVAIYGQISFHKTVERPVYDIAADTSPEGLARGEYLVRDVIGCSGCHGPAVAEGATPDRDAPLVGHAEAITFGPIDAGFNPPNLTPDDETGLGTWTDSEIARAIREGIDKDGVALVIMPSSEFHHLSDADVAAIVGYLRSLEPVRSEIPPVTANLVGKVVLSLGLFEPPNPTEPITSPVPLPQAGTVAYGKYFISVASCARCHSPNLAGGEYSFQQEGDPPAANLTPAGELAGWSEADFIIAMTTGQTPGGRTLADSMPWKDYARLHVEDLKAIYAYLKTVPPAEPKE